MTNEYTKNHPFLASIKERYRLNKTGSDKHTYHIVLDLHDSGIQYHVGDSIGVFATNDTAIVERTLQSRNYSGEEIVADKSGASLSLLEFLLTRANLKQVPRKLFNEVAQRLPAGEKKSTLESLLLEENKNALKGFLEVHEVWDFLKEYSEAPISAQELASFLMPLLPRFYSIASAQQAVGNEVHLTVALLKYETREIERTGVCTHFLCNRAPLFSKAVPIFVQPSHGFVLPENSSTPIIMVGPGTGIAPFRAFMQQRMLAEGTECNHWLFFGEWTQANDYFYQEYWEELQSKGVLKVDTAFSRDQSEKIYVQHRMKQSGPELFRWIQNGAVIYVCGDAHRMAKDVDAALHEIIEQEGRMTPEEAKLYMKQLRADKRYLRDIY